MNLSGVQRTDWLQIARSAPQTNSAKETAPTRDAVGELVGNIFYGTLIKQMQDSSIRGPFLHGGRAEEVFQGQLGMEIARRIGQAPGNRLTEDLTKAIHRRFGLQEAAVAAP